MGIAPITPELRAAVEANLFPAALPAVEPWNEFGWHGPETALITSSQALMIDVFGTLQLSPKRDQIIGHLAERLGLPTAGPWTVKMESGDPQNLVMEGPGITEVDVDLQSTHAVIFCECKFHEPSGAKCSQRKPIGKGANKGLLQCNGNYAMQTNPANGLNSPCALTSKGTRYWEIIPRIFDYAAEGEHRPCPFAGPWFQWMRNLTCAYEVAGHSGRRAAFLLAYADGPGLPVSNWAKSPRWQEFAGHLRPEAIGVGALSYQAILQLARETAPEELIWSELTQWVENKISRVCQVQKEKQTTQKLHAK
jgi:hypothetical protein